VSQKIKIAYILTPVTFGGAERVSLNFLKSVDRTKFDVNPILFLRPYEPEPYFLIELKKLGFRHVAFPIARKETGDFLRPIRCFSQLYSVLKNGCFDVVHTHGYQADLLGVSCCRLLGLPHLTTLHGFISTDKKLTFYNKISCMAFKLSTRMLCVSENLKKVLIAAGVSEKIIQVMPNAVPSDWGREIIQSKRKAVRKQLQVKEENFVIGYSGRLSLEKGLKYLILAFEELVQRNAELRLWIVGEGPQRTELEDLCCERNIVKYVTFTGFQENVIDFMAGMDVFVLPSLTEGTPMALLEAMSVGQPIIASEVGEVPRIISTSENGLLVSPGDTWQLSHAIHTVLDDASFAKRLSDNARQTVEKKYSIGAWVKKIEQIYLEVFNFYSS
jgi:glycosyltransferase involved in cell wall biosynthesis